jgi:hypothetical protein
MSIPCQQTAGRLAELHRQADERRRRQRQHYDLADGECGCPECRADEPVPIATAVDELMAALGFPVGEGGAR